MNASAPEFVPKKKSNDSGSNSTKLSAAAPPFVPPAKAGNATSPSRGADVPEPDSHTDPERPLSPLSAKASPYTPTNPKLAAKFPAAPAATDGDTGSGVAVPVAATEHHALEPLEQPLSAVEQLERQLAEDAPAAAALDWSESKLPALFGCHNTRAKATSEPIRLNTAWELYADDHGSIGSPLVGGGSAGANTAGSGGAGATTFEPILVSIVGDVESFWRLWRYLPPPSTCPVPFTYSWFRSDIKPEWEHPRNKRGGIITIVLYDRDKPGLNDKQVLDDVWMATLIGCAGESFAETAMTLNGVMLKLRPNNRPVTMQLWTAHSDSTKLRAFASSFRDAIGKIMGSKWLQKLEYYSHNQKQATSNTLAARLRVKPKISPEFTL